MTASKNIFPAIKGMVTRTNKEKLLKQRGKTVWMTGLSGSGKTTLAAGLEKELYKRGFLTQVLDGDKVRAGINSNLGFSEEDRTENIRRIAEVCKLLADCGVIVICCFISPTRAIRRMARQIIGDNDFIEVYVNAPLNVCEGRDVKGLYKKAKSGELKDFTGISAPYEPPEKPDFEIKTDKMSVESSVTKLTEYLLPAITP